jgi:hypothetical protein
VLHKNRRGAVRVLSENDPIYIRRMRPLLFALVPPFLLFVAACSSAKDRGASPSAPDAPRELTAKPAGGSSGVGPQVVSDSTATPGDGKQSSQKVVLRDRVLIINDVTLQASDSQSVASIDLDLSVQNTGDNDIMNQATFFRLIGAEGDTFGKQYNSSDTFYGTIDAHKSRRGAISFKIPQAATSTLRLLYRPEIPTETAIVPLKVG